MLVVLVHLLVALLEILQKSEVDFDVRVEDI